MKEIDVFKINDDDDDAADDDDMHCICANDQHFVKFHFFL